ncbi:MAG: hypothetical protein ABWY31_07025, partial [Pseudoxanthomonas sp.]
MSLLAATNPQKKNTVMSTPICDLRVCCVVMAVVVLPKMFEYRWSEAAATRRIASPNRRGAEAILVVRRRSQCHVQADSAVKIPKPFRNASRVAAWAG